MLRRNSSSSRARDRSIGSRASSSSRGRGRGAPSSSSKFFLSDEGHERRKDSKVRNDFGSRARYRFRAAEEYNIWRSEHKLTKVGNTSSSNSPNPFENERLENAAKREQRGYESATVGSKGGRGTSRGQYQNKNVRFASPPRQQQAGSSTAGSSPFITESAVLSAYANSTSNSNFGVLTSQTPFNPFTPTSSSTESLSTNTPTNSEAWSSFGSPSLANTPQTNPLSGPQMRGGLQQSSVFGAPSRLGPTFSTPDLSRNAATSSEKTSIFGASKSNSPAINSFHSAHKASTSNSASNPFSRRTVNPQSLSERGQPQKFSSQVSATSTFPLAGNPFSVAKNKLATEIDNLLRKSGLIAPSWPTSTPGDPRQKGAVEAFWQTTKAYRAKVRACLIQNGYLDDPDKPKKLSEAIDFKGTCEDMCPEFEKVTRIIEHDVQSAEKELSPDGQSYWPALHKMVKALARSAAGQDAPLPEDVRSPAALRRTLDYLIDIVLGTNDLPPIHGFLWDRTRAIRRDFVFQQSSLTSQELLDQVYCLEQITRFHVVALHQMSHEDVVAEDFSEQQEVEQLGKALLSLIHAYEDCMAQGIDCENEPEFRAYYVLFNSDDTGILEAVQDWGWKYWGKSSDIRTAVSLVETLQNIWDPHGPLRPQSVTDIAQNGYNRFFSIIEDAKVSYTMACFAEIHLNKVRKAALKTILVSYRKQRDQTTDWTLERLNMYLHFDDENDVIKFGEAFGLHFDIFNKQRYLSLDSDDSMTDPFPRLKQLHSYKLVERKRGDYTLPEVIHHTIYESMTEEHADVALFVPAPDTNVMSKRSNGFPFPRADAFLDPMDVPLTADVPLPETDTNKALALEEQNYVQIKESQDHARIDPVLSSNYGSIASLNNDKGADMAIFGYKTSGLGESNRSGDTSILDNKSIAPQQSALSFLNQNKAGPSIPSSSYPGSFSGISSILPPDTRTQTTEASKGSLPPKLAPLLPPLGVGGIFPSLEVVPSSITSTTSTMQLGSALDAPKEPVLKTVQSEANINRENLKQSFDHPSRNLLASPSIASTPPRSPMAALAEWVALSHDGLVAQYTEAVVERILKQAVKIYVTDEKRRRSQEEEKHSREVAARFRSNFLATKYFYRWRELAHRLWMRRRGRFARQARRQMAEESFRASRAAEKKDIVEEFKAFRSTRRKNTSGISIPLENRASDEAAKHKLKKPKKGSHLTDRESPSLLKEKQPDLDNALRETLLSESAYLHGGSRIHLIPNYSPKMEGRRQPNGVKTDYFRLKARGIRTLPNGTPLASTAAVHLHYRRSLDNIAKPMRPTRPISKPFASSVPSKPVANEVVPLEITTERMDNFEALKVKAQAIMEQEKNRKEKWKKRFLDDDDVELFAGAKRMRDQMDEDTEWMREMQKSLLTRS